MRKITIKNPDGTIEEVDLVKSFIILDGKKKDVLNKDFVIFSKNETTGEGQLKIYVSEVVETNPGIYELVGISNDVLWAEVVAKMKNIAHGIVNDVAKDKIDTNNVSSLNLGISNVKALLASPASVESLDLAVLPEQQIEESIDIPMPSERPETIEPPLFNSGHLEETRPVQPEPIPFDSIAPETPLMGGPTASPINRIASRIVGFDVTGPTPVDTPQAIEQEVVETPTITPVSTNVPNVSLDMGQSYQQNEPEPIYTEAQPQIQPVSIQSVNSENAPITELNPTDPVVAAINTQVATPQEPRREVIEQTLQTPQEIQAPEVQQTQDSYVDLNVRLEEVRNKINQEHEEYRQEVNRKFKEALDEFNRKTDGINKQINAMFDEMSRTIESARNSSDLNAVKTAVNRQFNQFNAYSGGIYNVR